MTADLTPAQAARLEAIEAAPWAEEAAVERVARALWETDVNDDVRGDRGDWMQAYRRLAVAAIDVMRGATDDGAIGRDGAVLDALDQTSDEAEADGCRPLIDARVVSQQFRAAIGAPATAEGDEA